jgi:hypothetical protein
MSDKDDIIGTATDVKTGTTAPLRRGRTSGLTAAVHARIVDAFRTEASVQTVAAACEVPVSTLHRWLNKGRAGHPNYERFALDVAAARNLHKSTWMANVERMAEGDSPHALRANLTLLARQFPDEWGDRDTVALDEHKAKKDETDFLKTLTPEELALLKAINAKRLASDNE